jgi:uncharacterized protein YjgD (DUF1641 family)
MENIDPIRLKLSVQNLSECAFKAIASENAEKAQPVGLMGLVKALRDPDVMTGLGVLIAMAKVLGGCVKEKGLNRECISFLAPHPRRHLS